MVEKVIVIQNKETTEDGTLIITMQPVANARWTSNSGLIEAGVAVQPYGVFMIPDAETFVSTGLMADVSINQVLFSTPLSALIAGDVEDEITFAAPYLNLTDLQDVTITSPSNGQALIWDATNSKWVNGSAGGGGSAGYTYQVTTLVNNESITMTGEGDNYEGVITTPLTLVEGDFYQVTVDSDSFIAQATELYDAIVLSSSNGLIFISPEGQAIYIYSESALTTIHLTVTHYVLTLTDGFKKAVDGCTIILETDGTGTGTPLDPLGLTNFDSTTAQYLCGKNVVIYDATAKIYLYPSFCQTWEESAFVGFGVASNDGGSFSMVCYGYYDTSK